MAVEIGGKRLACTISTETGGPSYGDVSITNPEEEFESAGVDGAGDGGDVEGEDETLALGGAAGSVGDVSRAAAGSLE